MPLREALTIVPEYDMDNFDEGYWVGNLPRKEAEYLAYYRNITYEYHQDDKESALWMYHHTPTARKSTQVAYPLLYYPPFLLQWSTRFC